MRLPGLGHAPRHLPTRYLATYAFFREALPAAAARLRGYLDRVKSGVMDEPATAQALASTVLRGVRCGAVEPLEVERLTGVPQAGSRRSCGARPPDPAGRPACRGADVAGTQDVPPYVLPAAVPRWPERRTSRDDAVLHTC